MAKSEKKSFSAKADAQASAKQAKSSAETKSSTKDARASAKETKSSAKSSTKDTKSNTKDAKSGSQKPPAPPEHTRQLRALRKASMPVYEGRPPLGVASWPKDGSDAESGSEDAGSGSDDAGSGSAADTGSEDAELDNADAAANSDAASDNDDTESDSDDEGVDEAGMERLMELLGDDGLDEFDQAQLGTIYGAEGDEEEGSAGSAEEEGSGEESGSEEEDEDEDEEEQPAAASSTKHAAADDAIPLDEIEDDVDEDAVPQRKLEIDNTVALARIRDTIQLDPSLPWTETLVLSYPDTIDVDVDDDLNRELAFYKQALHGANAARALAATHALPFTRPADYFAEMVKSDAHMERIRQRLLDEKAAIKKGEDRRREREGKKFGKQVQLERLREREQGKKEMEERLRSLKRKHKDVLDKPADDDFDVAVEDALADRPAKRGKHDGRGKPDGPKLARAARDKKFGFGGTNRRAKQNTRESTDDFEAGGRGGKGGRGGAGGRGGKGGPGGKKGFKPQRPGKSKRHASKQR